MKSRIEKEKETVRKMISIYCRAKHGGDSKSSEGKSSGGKSEDTLCESCSTLLSYAYARLDRCPFGGGKGVCSRCAIHCYKPEMRKDIGEVMRYSGKRMIFFYPIDALTHLYQLFITKKP